MVKRIVLAAGILMCATFALAEANSCWKVPCPYQRGTGAVCSVVLNQNGACYCYESGLPPNQSCTTSAFDCIANPNNDGCEQGTILTPLQKQRVIDQLSVTEKGPIKMHMRLKCENGPLGKFFRKEAAKRGITIIWVHGPEELRDPLK
jgi:hypothetical protein